MMARFVQQVPAYSLELGWDIPTIPALISGLLERIRPPRSHEDTKALYHPRRRRTSHPGLRARYDGPIVLAEGPPAQPLEDALRGHGYLPLVRRYDLEVVDLNRDEPVPVRVYDCRLRPLWLRAARTLVESDCRISVAPIKTQSHVIFTGCLKNAIMGALVVGEKVPGMTQPHGPISTIVERG